MHDAFFQGPRSDFWQGGALRVAASKYGGPGAKPLVRGLGDEAPRKFCELQV